MYVRARMILGTLACAALILSACGLGQTTGSTPPPSAVSSISPGPPVTPGPTPTPKETAGAEGFRSLMEGQVSSYCEESPSFAVALTREEWSEVSRRHWGCDPLADPAEMMLDWEEEFGVAAWWRVEGCLGWDVAVDSVERSGTTDVRVSATSSGPGEGDACATALGQLVSFIAVDRSFLKGSDQVVFIMDGQEVGGVSLPVG